MNRRTGIGLSFALIAATGLWTGCGTTTLTPNIITATSGTSQTATITAAFSLPLVVTVTQSGSPVQGVPVVFTAPASGASALFSNGAATLTVNTGNDGTATATVTANNIAGVYAILVSAPAANSTSAAITIGLQNTGSIYSFNLNGLEATDAYGVANYYALAGSVVMDSQGNVIAGEEDYNDGNGLTAVGATITGGALAINSSGTGTLTLQTNNTSVGVGGAETLAVQYVNTNHALIAQFDGSATSSGTLDAQTLTSAPSGSYSFTLSGVDPSGYNAYDAGGVLAVTGTSVTGMMDVNDAGSVDEGISISSGTLTAPDMFGRGELQGLSVAGTAINAEYYVVGPEVLRLIVVDSSGSALGSAFGQGTGTLSDTAIGNSVFTLFGNPYASSPYVVIGQLTTSQTASPSTFSALADATEGQNIYGGIYSPRSLTGPYAVSDGANGYGDLTITSWGTTLNGNPCAPWCWMDPPVSNMGLYTVDPKLNILDPNNTTSGLGGALVANMDENWAGGTGVVVPQTDTNTADFTGNYSLGWQDIWENIPNGVVISGGEFDIVGPGAVTTGSDTTGATPTPEFVVGSTSAELSDPMGAFNNGISALYSSATISAPLQADTVNAGRYTLDYNQQSTMTSITPANGSNPQYYGIVAYQASGSLLFWSDQDTDSISLGVLEAPGSLSGLPTTKARKVVPHPNVQAKKK